MTLNEIERVLIQLELTIRGNVNQNEFNYARNAYTALRVYADYKQEIISGSIKVDVEQIQKSLEKLNDF